MVGFLRRKALANPAQAPSSATPHSQPVPTVVCHFSTTLTNNETRQKSFQTTLTEKRKSLIAKKNERQQFNISNHHT
jgi:hypothetical protein